MNQEKRRDLEHLNVSNEHPPVISRLGVELSDDVSMVIPEQASDSLKAFIEQEGLEFTAKTEEEAVPGAREGDQGWDFEILEGEDAITAEGTIASQVAQRIEDGSDDPEVAPEEIEKLVSSWSKAWEKNYHDQVGQKAEEVPEHMKEMVGPVEAFYRKYFREYFGIDQDLTFLDDIIYTELPSKEGGASNNLPGYFNKETGEWVAGGATLMKKNVPQALDKDYAQESTQSGWLEAHERSPQAKKIEVKQGQVSIDMPDGEPVTLDITPENAWKWFVQYKDLIVFSHEKVHETMVPSWNLEFKKGEDGKPKFEKVFSTKNGAMVHNILGRKPPSLEEGLVETLRKRAVEELGPKMFREAYAFNLYLEKLGRENGLEEGQFRVFHLDPRVDEKNDEIILHTSSVKYEGGVNMVDYLNQVFEEEGIGQSFEALAHGMRVNDKHIPALNNALKKIFGDNAQSIGNKDEDYTTEEGYGSVLQLLLAATESPNDPYYAGSVVEQLKKLREQKSL